MKTDRWEKKLNTGCWSLEKNRSTCYVNCGAAGMWVREQNNNNAGKSVDISIVENNSEEIIIKISKRKTKNEG